MQETNFSLSENEPSDHDLSALDSSFELPSQRIIAVGGGKGGVGKSLIAANLAIYLAQVGKRTLLVDLDLGGANLHTFVGVNRPHVTLGDLFRKNVSRLEDCIVETSIKGLGLISAEGDPLWVADPRPTIKRRLLQDISSLQNVDFLICDLPAGSGFMALDFFTLAQTGILVIVPEPTSAENAYRFIKSAFLRRLRATKGEDGGPLSSLIEQLGLSTGYASEGGIPAPRDLYEALLPAHPEQARRIAQEIQSFTPHLVINQTRSRSDVLLGEQMRSAGTRRLGVPIEFLGYVDSDDAILHVIRKRKPLLTEYPESKAAKQIEMLARKLLAETDRQIEPIDFTKPQNLYQIIEVDPGASDEEIRKAIRRTREIYSTDSMVIGGLYSPERLHDFQRKIDESYDTLLDFEKRKRYDLKLFPDGIPASTHSRPALIRNDLVLPAIPSVIALPNMPSITPDTEFTGDLLRQVREAYGLDLTEIANRTKVGISQLRALEGEKWEEFPAPVYVRGFLVEYARCLKLDVVQVTKTYLARIPQHKS